jgi:hypothetical protein
MEVSNSFITQYLAYTANTEPPIFFHRWAAIVGLGSFLGRQYFFQHGHFNLHPNVYSMLIGDAGTRKGTAIKMMKMLLSEAGFKKFAAERTSKEKFLLDLAGETESGLLSPEDLLDQNIFGDGSSRPDCEIFIAIDEFNDFIGNGNIEFISMLGNMWDYNGVYENRIKTGKSVQINNPTISILGGNTPTGFSLAFPQDILGQGFFSRLLLVYADRSDRRITFPKRPDPVETSKLVHTLTQIKSKVYGPAQLTPGAEHMLDQIYQAGFHSEDPRFISYFNRKFTHLLKLCLIISASYCSTTITEEVVLEAHTLLTYTEQLMPKALGEFGKAKNSDITHKIVQAFNNSPGQILTIKDLWKYVDKDLEKISDLVVLMQNLIQADKVQQVPGGKGFLPKRRVVDTAATKFFNPMYLTDEERNVVL